MEERRSFMDKTSKFIPGLALAVFWSAFAGARSASAARESVEPVVAEAAVVFSSGDVQSAAGAAVNEAQRTAVAAVADLFLDPAAKAEKYELVRQNLLKSPQAYVKKRKMLYKSADGNFYRVRIRAYVLVDKVNAAVKNLSLAAQPGRSRKTVLAAGEYFNGQPSAAGDFARALSGWFKGRDTLLFADVKAPEQGWVPPRTWPDEGAGSAGESALFDAAGAAGAGLVLLGRAEALPLSAAQNLQPGFYPARAEARAGLYDVSGRQLFEVSAQANALDASEEAAFRKALAASGELLAQELSVRAERLLNQESPVALRVHGLSGIEAAQKLKEAVEKLDIAGAAFESFSGGTAVMKVALKRPDTQEFASALLRLGALPIDLESVNQQEVVFSLRE